MNIINQFYCFMLLLMISACDASRLLNNPSENLKVQRILNSLNKKPVKSIKSPDGDIIDCVLISHQPAFDYPLLKNHTIKMRPNDYPEGLFGEDKDDITKPITQLWHLNGNCPEGTVPIRRTKKENILRASSIDSFGKKQKNFSDFPSADPIHEHAYASVEKKAYYGAKATMNVWNPQIKDPREFSLSQFRIVGGPSSSLNAIEAGWIVYPRLLGYHIPELFIYWTSDNYKSTGCYNLDCPGFFQTSNKIALGALIRPFSTYHGAQIEITILVWKDRKEDVWWLKFGNEIVGYWPASLFRYLTNSAEQIKWGGEVTNYRVGGRHTATRMGSGHFAQEGFNGASYFRNLQVVDKSNILRFKRAFDGGSRLRGLLWEDLKQCNLPLPFIVGEHDAKFKKIVDKMLHNINYSSKIQSLFDDIDFFKSLIHGRFEGFGDIATLHFAFY